jgi:hypothetical protein
MAVAAGVRVGWLSAGAEGPRPAAAPTAADPCPECRLRGAGSCAAAACHNGNGPKGTKGSEYTTWVSRDPHADAFAVLYNERSQQIEKNLGQLAADKKPHPEGDPLCLNCHVQPGVEPLPKGGRRAPRGEEFSYEDGVSCESCHGPADKWLTEHYLPSWKQKSAADKAALGMVETRNLVVRAQVCVRCHVGENDMDVNHDLIASGHPRLAFEYAAFLANVPKHWSEAQDRAGRPDFEARVWAIGQVVSAEAALKLLAHRADPANERPWPEFAEYDCYSCHHDLTDQKWRRDPARVKGRLGIPGWGTWYFALQDVLARQPPPGLGYPEAQIRDLRKALSQLSSDREEVRPKANAAGKGLEEWLPALQKEGAWGVKESGKMLAGKVELRSGNWDEEAQLYLGLAAHNADGKWTGFLKGVRKQLRFPPTFDSPRGFGPRRPDEKENNGAK